MTKPTHPEREAQALKAEAVDPLRDAAVALAIEAGKLNVALDGQKKYHRQRQAVLHAMNGLNDALSQPAPKEAAIQPSAEGLAGELSDAMRGITPRPPADEAISLDWRLCDRILTALRTATPTRPEDDSERVERVARAICRAAITHEVVGDVPEGVIERMIENLAIKYFPEARAAIATLSPPPADGREAIRPPASEAVLREARDARTERGPMYHKPDFECDTCATPTTCGVHGRCMPIFGQNGPE